jgi:hypothetical protein
MRFCKVHGSLLSINLTLSLLAFCYCSKNRNNVHWPLSDWWCRWPIVVFPWVGSSSAAPAAPQNIRKKIRRQFYKFQQFHTTLHAHCTGSTSKRWVEINNKKSAAGWSVETRETREGWPLLTVETEVNGDSKEYKWMGSFLVGSLGSSCRYKIFFSSPYTISIHLSSSPNKLNKLGRQSCRVANLLSCVFDWDEDCFKNG